MEQDIPIQTLDLIPKIDELLIDVLTVLDIGQWDLPTNAPQWKVRDVASHLLDGNIRNISASRDHHYGITRPESQSFTDVVEFLNKENNEWVKVAKRMSPLILTELLGYTNRIYSKHLRTLDPFEKAIFPVAWAGEAESHNWFNIARIYTEKWHHQQQIRSAIGEEEILFFPLYFLPYIETSMRSIPHHLNNEKAEEGDTIEFGVEGHGKDYWYITYRNGKWDLSRQPSSNIVCSVSMPATLAWKLFSKELSAYDKERAVVIEGNKELAEKLLGVVAVMA